jgi:hypothetical protein
MLLGKTTQAVTNLNLPVYAPSAAENALAGVVGLNTWLETHDNFFQTSGGLLTGWVDRIAGRRFIPAVSTAPLIVPRGTRKALQFNWTGLINHSMRAEDGANLLSLTGYTVAFLTRVPIPVAAGGTEIAANVTPQGNVIGSANDTTYFGAAINSGGFPNIRNQGGTSAFLTSPTSVQDGLWHSHVFSYDFTSKGSAYRRDGVQIITGSVVASEMQTPSTDPASPTYKTLQMVLGGAGLTYTGTPMRAIEVGGIFHVAGRALHLPANAADLAALENYAAAVKTGLGA